MAIRRNLDFKAILSELEEFIEAGGANASILLDMIHSITKMMRDDPDRGDLKMLNTAFKELRYALRVFAPYRRVKKVSVFGSARTPSDATECRQAREFAHRRVPPAAAATSPARLPAAPETAPATWPNSSLCSTPSDSAEQLTATSRPALPLAR